MTRKFDTGRFAALFDMNGNATPAVWSDFLLALRRVIESSPKAQKLYTHTTLSKGCPNLFWCDASQAAFTITLPAAAEVPDEEYVFVKVSSGANGVTIDGYASETISGASTNTELLAEHDTLAVQSNGEEYFVTFRATGLTTGDHGVLAGLGDDDHAHYLKEEASGGLAAEVPDHTHASTAECGTIAHAATTGQTADDHHAKSHAHDGADGSGTVAHAATTGQTADDHHAQAHTLTSHSTKAHSELTGVGADDHHAKSHAHDGADGSGTVAHAATTGQTADDHHAQVHTLGGASHTADTLANLSVKVSDDDVCGLVAVQELSNKTLYATAAKADGTVLGATGVRFDAYLRDVNEQRSLNSNAVVYLGPAAAGVYTTLQAAINASPATGGTVYILPGYTETLTASITPKSNCAIICPTRDAAFDWNGTNGGNFFAGSATDVKLYGLNFRATLLKFVYVNIANVRWAIERCGSDALNYIALYITGNQTIMRDCFNWCAKFIIGPYSASITQDVLIENVSFTQTFTDYLIYLDNIQRVTFRSCSFVGVRPEIRVQQETVYATNKRLVFDNCYWKPSVGGGACVEFVNTDEPSAVTIADVQILNCEMVKGSQPCDALAVVGANLTVNDVHVAGNVFRLVGNAFLLNTGVQNRWRIAHNQYNSVATKYNFTGGVQTDFVFAKDGL